LFALALPVVPSRFAGADEAPSPEAEAQRLVHVLGYVGADYGGAVERGAVKNEDEYKEQLSLLDDGAKIAERIAPARSQAAKNVDVPGLVGRVRKLVTDKAAAPDVEAATTEAKQAIIGAFALSEAPERAPSLDRGRALFAQNCAVCHGALGKADTPQAATLKPPPSNFWNPDVADGLTPFRVANTVRFGVAGTGPAWFEPARIGPGCGFQCAVSCIEGVIGPAGARDAAPDDTYRATRYLPTHVRCIRCHTGSGDSGPAGCR